MTWAVEGAGPDAQLVWIWVESGGPPVSQPVHRGFGSSLVERVLATDLEGTVSIAFEPGGLRCNLRAPLQTLSDHPL